MAKNPTLKTLQGIGQSITDLFRPSRIAADRDKRPPTLQQKFPGYPEEKPKEERIKFLGARFYREGAFERVQFTRKWMRNALVFQGYHELEWSEINVAWEAIIRDSGDYAFPNNYYRSHIMKGAAMYVKNEPQFVGQPTSEDFAAQGAAKAAKSALDVMKENVHYDYLRVLEAIYLRLFGNSFRYSYFSLDPRYGHVVKPTYESQEFLLDAGSFTCPMCGLQGEGNPPACPACQSPLPPETMAAPAMGTMPMQTGTVKYPRGQEVCEVVSPMEIGVRNSTPNLWHAPYLYRARVVDRVALQADFPKINLGYAGGIDGSGEGGDTSSAAASDLSIVYQESLADLPGDPTQYAAWYERATSYGRVMLLQVWIRPAQYSFDKSLAEDYPDGLYAAIVGDRLLESRNESIDDHWVHFPYNPVPGRFWADGDDDLIPKQLQLNETERLILRNEAYSSVPQLAIDAQRIDEDKIINDPAEIILVKQTGRPVSEALYQLQGQALPQETWLWRNALLADMEYHSGVFSSVVGQNMPSNRTYGGQQDLANQAEQMLSPLLLIYKEANEQWARQMLKIAAANWLDDRVKSVMGINGNWEFTKLRSNSLDLDQAKIIANVMPIDYSQQQALATAVNSQLLNPQDPRVQRKALEMFGLPTELNQFSQDAKVQWEELEQMKQGQPVMPTMLVDNDDVHGEICRTWLNSDEGRAAPPEIRQIVIMHIQAHMMNKTKLMMAQAAMASAPQQVMQAHGVNPGQGQGQSGASEQQRQGQPQAGRRGGQVPKSPAARQQRAAKGQAGKPNRPQPPSGNQYHRGRVVQ